MTKRIVRPSKDKQRFKDQPQLPLAKRGYGPYLGTVGLCNTSPAKIGIEPNSDRVVNPDSIKGVITHGVLGCGAITEVWISKSEIGRPFSFICSGCNQTVSADRILESPPCELNFSVYGDESSYGTISVYGLLLLRELDVASAEVDFSRLLADTSGKQDARLHCREIFNEEARRRSVWSQLDKSQVWELIRSVLSTLERYKATYLLGIADRATWPQSLPGKLGPISVSRDHMYPVAFKASVMALDHRGFLDDSVKLDVCLDPQRNLTEYSGLGHSKVDSFLKAILPIAAVPSGNKPLLLDVADLFSYISAHAFSEQGSRDHEVFGELLRVCAPAVAVARWIPKHPNRVFDLKEVEGVLVKSSAVPAGIHATHDTSIDWKLAESNLPPPKGWSVSKASSSC